MNFRRFLVSAACLMLVGLLTLAQAANPENALNTRYAKALLDVKKILRAQGVEVTKVEFTGQQQKGAILVAVVEFHFENFATPASLFINIEIGGAYLGEKEATSEILRKSAPIIPRLAIELGNRSATPGMEMKALVQEVATRLAFIETQKQALARDKMKPGSYFEGMAQAQERAIRLYIKGVGEIYYEHNEGPVKREVLFLNDSTPLDAKALAPLEDSLRKAVDTYTAGMHSMEEKLQDGSMRFTSMTPQEALDFKAEILNIDFAIKRLTHLLELMERHKQLLSKAGAAATKATVGTDEKAVMEDHARMLGTLETYLKNVLKVTELGLEEGKLSGVREAMLHGYHEVQKITKSGLYLEGLRHSWGIGAELAQLKEQVKASPQANEVLRLKAHLYHCMAALTLELDAFERQGQDLGMSKAEKAQLELKFTELKHLRFQLKALLRIEAAPRGPRAK